MDRIESLYESIADTIIATNSVLSETVLTPRSPHKSSTKLNDQLPLLARSNSERRKFVDSSAVVILSMETAQARPASLDRCLELLGPKPTREYKRRKISVDCTSLSSDDLSTRVSTLPEDTASESFEPIKRHQAAQHSKYTYNPITLYANYYHAQTSKRSMDEVYKELYSHLLSKHDIKPCTVDLSDCFRQEPLKGMKAPVVLDKALKRRLKISTKS